MLNARIVSRPLDIPRFTILAVAAGTVRDLTIFFVTDEDGNPPALQITGSGTLDISTGIASGDWTLEDTVTPSTDSGTWDGSLCP
jgi:hypothetical protein